MLLSLLAVAGCATGGPASSKNTDSAVDSDTGMVNDSGTEDSGGQDSFNVTDVADLAWATWSPTDTLCEFGWARATFGVGLVNRVGDTPLVAITETAWDDYRNLIGLFPVAAGAHSSDEAMGQLHGTVADGDMGLGNSLVDLDGDGTEEFFAYLTGFPTVPDDVSVAVGEVETAATGDSYYGNGLFTFETTGAEPGVVYSMVAFDRLGTGKDSLAFAPYNDGATMDLLVYDDPTAGSVTAEEADTVVSRHAWSDYFGNTLTADVNDDGYDDLVAWFATDSGWISILFGPVEDGASLDAADVSVVPSFTDVSPYSYVDHVGIMDVDSDGALDLAWVGSASISMDGDPYPFMTIGAGVAGDHEFADATTWFELPDEVDLAATGDLDGDGLDDLVLRSLERGFVVPDMYCLAVIWSPLTASSGIGANWLCDAAGLEVSTPSLGETVDATHDVDGDGLADMFATAPTDLGPTQNVTRGIVYLVPGSAMVTLKP